MNNNRDQSERQFIGELCWNKHSKLCCAFLDHKSCPGSHCMGIETAVGDRFAFFFVLSFRAWANLLTQLHFLYNYPRETAFRNVYSITFLTFITKQVDQSYCLNAGLDMCISNAAVMPRPVITCKGLRRLNFILKPSFYQPYSLRKNIFIQRA